MVARRNSWRIHSNSFTVLGPAGDDFVERRRQDPVGFAVQRVESGPAGQGRVDGLYKAGQEAAVGDYVVADNVEGLFAPPHGGFRRPGRDGRGEKGALLPLHDGDEVGRVYNVQTGPWYAERVDRQVLVLVSATHVSAGPGRRLLEPHTSCACTSPMLHLIMPRMGLRNGIAVATRGGSFASCVNCKSAEKKMYVAVMAPAIVIKAVCAVVNLVMASSGKLRSMVLSVPSTILELA